MDNLSFVRNGKVFDTPFKKEKIYFCGDTLGIFKIDNLASNILKLAENNLSKSKIIKRLKRRHGSNRVKGAFQELAEMNRRGFLNRMKLKDWLNSALKIESKKINTLDIYLTHDCNMACSYCCNKGGDFGIPFKTRKMSWKTAKATFDWFFSQNQYSQEPLTICFFGGEPLLNLPVFAKSLNFIRRKWYPRIKVPLRLLLSTNGTLLNKEILDLVAKSGCQLVISMDSCRLEHDRNRILKNKGKTYDIILNNIRYAKKMFPEVKIIINSTTNHNSDLGNIFKYKYADTNPKIEHRFNVEHSIFKSFIRNTKSQLIFINNFKNELKNNYLTSLKNGRKFIYLETEAFNSLNNRKNSLFNKSYCGAAISKASVSAAGDIYPCSLGLFDKRLKIGSVFSGLDRKKINWFFRKNRSLRKFRAEHCFNCWAKNICAGFCYLLPFKESSMSNLSKKQNEFDLSCDLKRVSIEYGIRSYERLGMEEAQRYFGEITRNNKIPKGKLDLKEKIRLTYLYRDLINQNHRHIKCLNPI